jgi:hypothetical protein
MLIAIPGPADGLVGAVVTESAKRGA